MKILQVNINNISEGAIQNKYHCLHLHHLIPAEGHTASVREEALLFQLSWP